MFTNGTVATHSVIPVDGSLAIAGAGALYSAPSSYGKKTECLIPPNQLIIVDQDKLNSLGGAPSAATDPIIHFAVGVDVNGNGVTDEYLFSGPFGPTSANHYDTTRPECGQSSIVDVVFDCAIRGETYTIEIVWKSNDTDSFGRMNQGFRYSFSFTPSWDDCEQCDVAVESDEVMCGLYNTINKLDAPGTWDVKLNGEAVPADFEFPFYVVKLFSGDSPSDDTTFVYNLAPDQTDDGECENCLNFPALKGMSSATDSGVDTTFTTPITSIGGNDYTKKGLLETIAQQISDGLGGKGDAVVYDCAGPCCTAKLEVNTCLTDFTLIDNDDQEIAATSASNPFTAQGVYQECEDCKHPALTKTYSSGLRVIAKTQDLPDNLVPTNDIPDSVVSELEVYPRFGWNEQGGAKVITRQTPIEPVNMGWQWVVTERQTKERGSGQAVDQYLRGGTQGAPVGNDLLLKLLVNEKTPYCSVQIKARFDGHQNPVKGMYRSPEHLLSILVPDRGSVPTVSSGLRTALNGYFSSITVAEVCGDTA